jgi:DNA-binding PadR family transcriptional regulator
MLPLFAEMAGSLFRMWPFRWMMHGKRGLRMLILSMLSTSPMNGVEIMNEIESATRGRWRPSPGSVYPALDQLVKEGMVKKRDDGKYELTSKADTQLEWPFGPPRRETQSIEDMLTEIDSYVSYFEELKASGGSDIGKYSDRIKTLIDRMSKLLQP